MTKFEVYILCIAGMLPYHYRKTQEHKKLNPCLFSPFSLGALLKMLETFPYKHTFTHTFSDNASFVHLVFITVLSKESYFVVYS